MRILLVAAAAVALSVSAAQAQDRGDRALPAATPSSSLIEQLKAAGELKDPKVLEAPAPRLESLEPKPAEQPVAATPADTAAPAAVPASTAIAPAATPPAAAAPAATTTAAKPAE